MKFRAVITDSTYIQRFKHAVQLISKFCKQCVIRISVDGLFIIAFEDGAERHPVSWFKMPQQQYFTEYNLVGLSPEHNEICLKCSTQMLLTVLVYFKPTEMGSKAMKISLTNRKTPCLTCELIRMGSQPTRLGSHDIPVEVVPRKEWADLETPEIALKPDLTVTLPDIEKFESIWERVKLLSRFIVVLANGRGSLSLRIETDLLEVTSHFKNLIVTCSEDIENLDDFVKARVKCNKFLLIKDLYLSSTIKVHLHIRNRKYILFDVFYDELTLHYIVPAVKK